MKFLKKFNLFEREMSQDWVDSNKDFYLMQNKEDIQNKASKPKIDEFGDAESIITEIRTIIKTISIDDLNVRLIERTDKAEKWSVSIKENIALSTLVHKYRKITHNRFRLGIDFEVEYPLNRLHTLAGLSDNLTGIGLGYKMYKALINEIGYGRSSIFFSNENSRKVWYHLIQDKDYYSIILNKGVKENDIVPSFSNMELELEGVMIISKKYKGNIQELLDKCKETFTTVEIDSTLNESFDFDDDGEDEEDEETFYEDLEDSKNIWGVIRVWSVDTGNEGYIIEPHSLRYKHGDWMKPNSIKFTMVKEEFLNVAKNTEYRSEGLYQKDKHKYRITINIVSIKTCKRFPDAYSIGKVISFLTEKNVPVNKFRFDVTTHVRENINFDDEDEEEDDVYSETTKFITTLNNSKNKWGTFNLLIGRHENPITCIIDTSSVSTYVSSVGFLNITFINNRLLDDYDTMLYNSINDFFEIVDQDYTLTYRVFKGWNGMSNIKFASDDDKTRFANLIRQVEDIENEPEILSSMIDYLKK